jgi:glycosyltransferase involved in cell wall biosynthesis
VQPKLTLSGSRGGTADEQYIQHAHSGRSSPGRTTIICGCEVLRIIILVRILWTAGAQKLAIAEARKLIEMGHQVDLVFLRGSALGGYGDILQGLSYQVLPRRGRSALSPVYEWLTALFAPGRGSESTVDLDLIRAFPKSIESRNPDLVICHDQWAGLAGYLAKRSLGVDYVVYVHEKTIPYSVPILGQVADAVEHVVLANARRVLAVTEKVAHTIYSKHGIRAVPDYIGMDVSSIPSFEAKEANLIAVSMWDSGRKPEVYLSVIEAIPEYRLLFVGRWRNPSTRLDFLRRAQDMGVADRVVLMEGVTELELDDAYCRSKFYLRFGFDEFGSGSTVEAIQHAIPLIVNRDLGTADLIQSYGAGLVMEEIDPLRIRDFVRRSDSIEAYGTIQGNVVRLASSHSWADHCRLLVS